MCTMDRWVDKVAIVTGGSQGIGFATAEKLVNAGVKVVAVARRKAILEDTAKKLEGKKGKIYTYVADVSIEEDIIELFKWTKENVGPVHILINNASSYGLTNLTEGDTKVWKDILDVQIIGLCVATREAVQDMRANKVDGHIIHINSIDGHKVTNFPNLNVVAASKYAVTALTETLRNELNLFQDKIKVSSISPGYVNSEGAREVVEEMKKSMTPEELKEFADAPMLQPEDVADAIMYVLGTPPHVQIHELMIKPLGEQI